MMAESNAICSGGDSDFGPREQRRGSESTVGSSFRDEALRFHSTRVPRRGEHRTVSSDSSTVENSACEGRAEFGALLSSTERTPGRGTLYASSVPEEKSLNSSEHSIIRNKSSIGSSISTTDYNNTYSWEFTLGSSPTKESTRTRDFSRRKLSLQSKYQRRYSRSMSMKKKLSDLTVNQLHFEALDRLYGRDRECTMLRQAWEEILLARPLPDTSATNEHREYEGPAGKKSAGKISARRLVNVSGLSGTGKSALADTLRGAVQQEGGFFLQGKFPQQHRLSRHSVEPYVAFAAACDELCELVISLDSPTDSLVPDEEISHNSKKYLKFTLDQFRDKLNHEIGAEALVLTRLVPGLLQVLKVDSSSTESVSGSIGMREAHHQFKFAFRRLIRAVTSFGPIVLTLDDLQWADAASMELLEALISDRENTSFMVIGIYRSDDLFSNQPHIKAIENIKKMSLLDSSLKVDSISIGNIEVEQVNHLLVDLLSSKEVDTSALAECVHRKTLGNVFFVIQFVTMLQELKLLEYSIGALKWTWDVHQIQASTVATENVVILMKDKMERLPISIRKVLPMMACLGSSFSLTVFELVVEQFSPVWEADPEETIRKEGSGDPERDFPNLPVSHSKALALLVRCEEEGLIELGDEDQTYRWVHDKIQEAAYCLIADEELQALKLELGKILYEGLDPFGLEKNLFVVADLLNVEDPGESSLSYQNPVEVAKLYLRAGRKGLETSAHEQATEYLTKGIDLLPKDHWEALYDLSLELYSSAAEAEFCVGNFDKMRSYCDQIISQKDRPLLDKKRALMVILESTGAEHRLSDALAQCKSISAQLGCKFPKRGVSLHVRAGITRIKYALKTLTPGEVSRLTTMTDESKLWLMEVLDRFVHYSYMVKSNLLPLAIFKGIHMTLNDGVSDYAPVIFASVGFTLATYLGDYKGGVVYANHGLQLLQQVKSVRKVEARVLLVSYGFVLHWSRPITLSIKAFLKGYDVGMSMGDTGSGAWCIKFFLEFSLRAGTSLEKVLADCAFYSEQLREVKQLKILAIVRVLWQVILFLTGDNSFSGTMSGDVFDQENFLRQAEKGFDHTVATLHRMRMYVAFVFGDYETVYESVVMTGMAKGSYERISPGTLGLVHLNVFNGLSMFSLYRQTNDKKYLKLGRKMAAKIKAWAVAGNPNVIHYDSLLDAEMYSLRGDVRSAARRFEAAVTYSGRRGLRHDQALAHERFGEHFARLGQRFVYDAEFHLGEAVKLYQEWGAHGKVRQLQRQHETVLGPPSEIQVQLVF